jgi:hypothetical protein
MVESPPYVISELLDKRDPDWLAFWNARHPLQPSAAGFDPDMPLHRVWAEWRDGEMISACMFVPMIQEGLFLGHHAYIASKHRSKCLIRFCREMMDQVESDPLFGIVSIETQQRDDLRCIDKLAKFIGFHPVRFEGMAWDDYLWNSKGKTLCHQ